MNKQVFLIKEEKKEELFDRVNNTIWFIQAQSNINTDEPLGLPPILLCQRKNVIDKAIRDLFKIAQKIIYGNFFTFDEANKTLELVGRYNSDEIFEEVK